MSRAGHAAAKPAPVRGPAAPGVADPAGVRRRLLRWYARAKRDLPWRGTRDPYAVWISEVMLQQTQVERVKDYFTRFLGRFPTVGHLARAREVDVLKLWEGLGYYRRARQMHAAAKAVVVGHDGRFPRSVEALRSLPGIGRYTAGAIASIAFDLPAPIVEANSRRVLARLVAHDRPVGGPGDEPIWAVAAALVPRRGAGGFNQALMDLGATICTPTRPACGRCPLAERCAARATGRQESLPVMVQPAATRRIRETAVVARHGDLVLVVRRAEGDWWAGLWDFPREPAGGRGRELGRFAYGVTNHRISCVAVERPRASAGPVPTGGRWVPVATLPRLAMTAPGRRIARLVAVDPPPRARISQTRSRAAPRPRGRDAAGSRRAAGGSMRARRA